MARFYRLFLLFFITATYCNAQVQLTNFYPHAANYYDTLFIVGSGFGNDANQLKVHLGAGKAQISSVSDQLIKVVVPNTATFGSVVVTDLLNQLSLSFPVPFSPTYQSSSFDNSNLSLNNKIINEEAGLYDLCSCDFDLDGDIDIATVNNDESAKITSVDVFTNTTATPDNVSFVNVTGSNFNINAPARNVKCSDLDGDGMAELIVSQGGTVAENIYVFQNLSSPSSIRFSSPIVLSTNFEGLTNGTRRIEIHDLDGDHKPEIVVSNQTAKVLIVFKNESSGGIIKFPTDKRHFINVPTNTLGLVINDIDGDNKADIIASNNLGSNFYVIKNKSTPGIFTFAPPLTINISGQLVNLASGDIDKDGKQDIVLTDFDDGAIILLLNQSTSSEITFATPIRMNAAFQPWGITLADISGNQQTDIIVSTQASTDKVLILKNNSLPGDPNFELIHAGYPAAYRNINVADVNNDAKPDILVTEKDAFGNHTIDYIQNTSCQEVIIFPENPPAICEASPLTLHTYQNTNLSYQWKKDGSPITGETNTSLVVSQAGTYTLEVTDIYSTCITSSDDIVITEDSGEKPEVPDITAPAQVCEGDDIVMSVAFEPDLTYRWSGPNGFKSTEVNPVIPNAGIQHAGEYLLEVRKGLCNSSRKSVIINIIEQQTLSVSVNGSLNLCPQDSVTLLLDDAGLTNIQWFKNDEPVSGATTGSIKISESGNFYASAKNSNGCTAITDIFVIEKNILDATFDIDATSICVGDTLTLNSNNSSHNSSEYTYQWEFGNGTLTTGTTTQYVYNSAGTYLITHTVILGDGICSNQLTKSITVLPSPSFQINTSSEIICENDTVSLNITGETGSLVWEDGSTQTTRLITEEGTYSVTLINESGCSTTKSILIHQGSSPEVSIEILGSDHITRGDSIQISASGAEAYFWFAADGLRDSTIANPFVKPTHTTTYTLQGTSEDGCSTLSEVTIYVEIDQITLDALDIFSPNGDGIEDRWVVNNFDQYPECYFIVFDIQGREVYRSGLPYQNDWEGQNSQGSPLPEGVYYYVVRCDGKNNKGSGSVTILR
ncbi:gliding motility-associated-like protein [Catalinimonas alkaloidigena]|uniref:FG-GAP-like repeat-containing protein n=1 Tax=Catalinimonas alkaloidigena TaxID=1075417 RepID=UPI002404A4BC|nr:FG-GAP-like repeat-containing protein [Catalinimonas alkaloidigena]MDF9797553.1 gliding motility-associated-like protein [Catalinimonas alkaloidigena]